MYLTIEEIHKGARQEEIRAQMVNEAQRRKGVCGILPCSGLASF